MWKVFLLLISIFLDFHEVASVHCTELGAVKLDAALFPLILWKRENVFLIIKSLQFLIYKFTWVLGLQNHFQNGFFFSVARPVLGIEINRVKIANFYYT